MLDWFISTRFWRWLSGKVLNHIVIRLWGYPNFPLDPSLFQLYKSIQAWQTSGNLGVIAFVCTDRASLTGRLVRALTHGRYSHAGIIVPGSSFTEMKAIHVTANGLHVEHPMNVFSEATDVAIVAFKLEESKYNTAMQRINDLSLVDISYDFEQKLGTEKQVYCSELVYRVLNGLHTLTTRSIAHREVYAPDDVASNGTLLFSHKVR